MTFLNIRILWLLVIWGGGTAGKALGLLQALCSKINLVVFRGPYMMLGIEPGLITCKTNILITVLLLQPPSDFF